MTTLLDTRFENRERVVPNQANNYGTVHGGNVMKWMDEVGGLSAMRLAGKDCVTAAVDQMNFRRPIPVGDVAYIESYVYDTGNTSVKVHLRAAREDPHTGEQEPTTESYYVYVAIEDGEPTPVPDLEVETEEGRELRERALEGERED